MSMLSVSAPVANSNPITEADLKRAAFFNLALPAGPIDGNSSHKVASGLQIDQATVVAIVPEASAPSGWGEVEADDEVRNVWDPGDSWDGWDETKDRPWGLGEDAEPIDDPAEPEAMVELTPFESRTIIPSGVRRAEVAPGRLAINGFQYSVRPIPVAAECGSAAFELVKLDTRNTYHVRRDEFGVVSCSCPDYLMRHDGAGSCCKHGAKLVEAGLVEPPAPIHSTLGVRKFDTPKVSILTNPTPTRMDYPLPRRRRFVPSPEEMAEAAAIFAEVEEDRRAWSRQYAESL